MTETDHKPVTKRWPKRLLKIAAVLGLVAVLLPTVGGLVAPSFVTRELEKRLDVRAEIGDLDLSYAGRASLEDFELIDPEGRRLARFERVDVDADIQSAIGGVYKARVDVDGFEVHVRRTADGSWNLLHVLRPADDDDDDSDDGSSKKDAPPDVEAIIRVKNGRVIIHGEGGTTELVDLALSADVDGLTDPARFELGLGLAGPAGAAGRVSVSGDAALLERKDDAPLATAHIEVEALLLEALAPLVHLFLPNATVAGRLDVGLDLQVLDRLAVKGGGDVTLSDLVLPAGRAGADPIRLGLVSVESRADVDANLAGTQSATITVDDFLTLTYDGEVARANDDVRLTGHVSVDGSMARLAELADAFVPIKQDVRVAGTVSSKSDFALNVGAAGFTSGSLSTETTLVDVAATGPNGPIDLGQLTEAEVKFTAAGDLSAGTAKLSDLDAKIGSVGVRGRAAVSGVDPDALGAVRLEDSRFEIDADLDHLVNDLAALVDLEEFGLAGQLSLVASGKQDGDAIVADAELTPRGLVAKGMTLDAAPVRINATVTPSDELLTANATLSTERLSLSLPDGRSVNQRDVTLQTLIGRSKIGAISGDVTVDARMDGLAGLLRDALPLVSGAELAAHVDSKTTFSLDPFEAGGPSAGTLVTHTVLDELTATGPAGPIDLGALTRLELDLDAGGDLDAGSARLAKLDASLGSATIRASGAATGFNPRASFVQSDIRLEDSRFDVDADLSELTRDLGALIDLDALGAGDLGGHVNVSATARQDGDSIVASATITPKNVLAKGITLDAEPVRVEATMTSTEARTDASATVESSRLSITTADGRRVEQSDLSARAVLEHEAAADVLTIRDAGFMSKTAEVDVVGRVLAASDATERTAELGVDLRAALDAIERDLAAFLGTLPYDGSADITAHADVTARADEVSVSSKTTLDRLDVTVTPKDASAEPLRVTEDQVVIDLTAGLTRATGTLEIERLDLASELMRGGLAGTVRGAIPEQDAEEGAARSITLDGIKGEFFYVPDRLGKLLAPYLPAEMKGAEEEHLTLDLNGTLDDFDALTLLESSKGGIDVGLGTLLLPGVETDGTMALKLAAGRASLTGDLGANGGTVDLEGDLGTSDPENASSGEAQLKLDVKQFAVKSGLGDLLSVAHPLFSSFGDLSGNTVGGVVDCEIQLNYGEPLTLQRLARDWQTLDPNLLEGGVHFKIDDAIIQGSPLLSQLLGKIDVPVGEEIAISPVNLTIGGGRMTYAEPWKWKFGDVKTNFDGSIGFDRSLDLGWNLPITKKIIKKYDFLKPLKGQSIAVPLQGTSSSPDLRFDSVLTQLATKAAKGTLAEELGVGGLATGIPQLDDLLGTGKGNDDGSTESDVPPLPEIPEAPETTDEPPTTDEPSPEEPEEPTPTDPAEILKKADALWSAGEAKPARKLYKLLKQKHKISIVYLLNKNRIEDRAKKKK